MIEAVERLKKFVDKVENSNTRLCGIEIGDLKLTLSDLKEALSLIPPYAPGEEIHVRDHETETQAELTQARAVPVEEDK